MTPWGDSDSLRGRRLSPGPGGSRGEVERNQHERLFGALVASVAAKGYEATTVADLTEVSGVSSRTFYDLFADKRACLAAAVEALVEGAVGVATVVANDSELGSWEERARAGSRALAELAAGQPAATRLVLVDAQAAGAEVLAPLEQAFVGFEWLAGQMVEQSPERAEMPGEMISAYIGAIEEVVRLRVVDSRESELPGLMDELWDLIGSYRPPPAPLRLAGRAPKTGAESLAGHDHAERALRAFAIVVAERGYAETTVEAVLRRAGMSATTFYANFGGKEDAMSAALESGGAQIVAAIGPALRRAPDWASAVRAGIGALFNFLASRPALARLLVVEVFAAGPEALVRRVEYLAPLEELLAEGPERAAEAPSGTGATEAPAITAELIAGVAYSLAYRRIRESGPATLPSLAPICAYLALAPFVGAEEACTVANGDGGARARLRGA
jgi:AcrR family transcriptional regulator